MDLNIDLTDAKKKDPKSEKIGQLVREGYPQEQAIAIAYSEERQGKLKGGTGLRTRKNVHGT